MRFRYAVLHLFLIASVAASAVSVSGQDEGGKDEERLEFTAGGKEFRKRPDGTFLNRYYRGVVTRHLDARLEANEGVYDSRLGEVRFYGNAAFEDSVRRLFADTLIYYEKLHEAYAVGNVRVTEGDRKLTADTVYYQKDIRYIKASGNVWVHDDSTNSTIRGTIAEFNDSTGYGLVVGEPFLKKIDDDGSVMTVSCRDTLELLERQQIIRLWRDIVAVKDSMTLSCSDTLEIYDSNNTVRLWKNVMAVRDSMTAISQAAVYDDSTETLILTGKPRIRYAVADTRDEAPSELQTVSVATGDSIRVTVRDRKIAGAQIVGSAASTTTSVDTTGTLFDRSIIESLSMRLEMKDDFISRISAEGTAQSYYHRNYAEDGKILLNDASGDTLTFYFDRGSMSEMRIFGFGGGLGKGKYYDYEVEKPVAANDSSETR